jgi:hypothetical protein
MIQVTYPNLSPVTFIRTTLIGEECHGSFCSADCRSAECRFTGGYSTNCAFCHVVIIIVKREFFLLFNSMASINDFCQIYNVFYEQI